MAFRTYDLPVLVRPGRTGTINSYEAASAISQGQLVKHDGTDTDQVTPSDTDGEATAGFALYDAAAGDTVAVVEGGTRVRATSGSGGISGGDLVTSHGGTGESGELDTAGTGDYVIGRAVADDSGTNDDVIVDVDHMGNEP